MIAVLMRQVLIMFLLIVVGFLMFRKGKITLDGSKNLGNILLFVSLPSVIIKSFFLEKTPEMITGIGLSAAAALLSLLAAILVSRLLFPKDGMAAFAGAFSNPGFFGIPLIAASVRESAVVYVACYIAFLNLFQWSYGVALLTGEKKGQNLKQLLLKMIKAPFMMAILIGAGVFLTGISVPALLKEGIGYAAGLNTPLAMFTVGVYLAQVNFREMLRNRKLLAISAVRLIVVPLVVCVLLRLLFAGSEMDMMMAVLIASACPVGSNIAVYAQLYESDYTYAVETVVVSTLLCIITIPLIMQISLYLL